MNRLLPAILLCATCVVASHGLAAPAGFFVPHGKGGLRLPISDPFDQAGASVEWKDQCGLGERICAEATVGGRRLYLLGRSLPALEASRPLVCERGAKGDSHRQTCTLATREFFTWSRKLGRVLVAVSADAEGLDSRALVVWLDGIRWEEK